MFSVKNNQGDYWLHGFANITSTARYFIVIEGVIGTGGNFGKWMVASLKRLAEPVRKAKMLSIIRKIK